MTGSPSEAPPPPTPQSPDALPLARRPPVAGWKVAVTLIAIIAVWCLVCVAFAVLYPHYMSLHG